MPSVIYGEINRDHSYEEVWEFQKSLQKKLIQRKRADQLVHAGYLLLCEHAPVFTLGKSGDLSNLTISEDQLSEENTEFFKINRGGDITYHGPGQITGYPILDLDQFYNDVHRYVRELEEIVIRTIDHYGLKGHRIDGYTGVWLKEGQKKRKICAIGVHMSRWVSMHGFALNVGTNLNYFDQIIPCGIQEEDMTVTSIEKELAKRIDLEEVRKYLIFHFQEVFQCKIVNH